ncbi:MAG: SDR family oxidoreductase, partial [Prevotellaceae bacterium]|nr:SDR family oxidoreductase [Prevotellaceae bacterium]
MKGKAVIVTGATSGIGLALAGAFAGEGARVCLVGRDGEKLRAVLEDLQLRYTGVELVTVVADVSLEGDCKRAVEACVARFGGIDVLVNNAGISMRALFKDLDLNVIRQLMNVNFWGTVFCTKFALPYLLASKGSVVGVSSIAGFKGLPARTGYSASKFAMQGFLETIRIEHLYDGLHVMVI